MKKISFATFAISVLLTLLASCKKETTQVLDFSSYVATDNECHVTGATDTTEWANTILTRKQDTSRLTFADNIVITDTVAGTITISPPCPNPSNGFFIWNIHPERQCKLRLVCINAANDIIYYNAYGLSGGPMTIGFDFRNTSTFHPGTNYRMYYGFYNAKDSLYFAGHGDIRIQ